MDWTPSEEEKESTKNELGNLPENGIWALPSNHAVYQRQGLESTLKLIQRMDHPAIAEGCNRVKLVCELIGWEVHDDDAEILPFETTSPEEMMFQERVRRQEMLMQATCSNNDCQTLVASMDLESPNWTHIRDVEMEDDDGNKQAVEVWSPIITCHDCSEEVKMMPEDYAILAGDDLATRFKTKGGVEYRVLTRDEVIHLVDINDMGSVHILGTFCPFNREIIPPHFRALITQFTLPDISEEE